MTVRELLTRLQGELAEWEFKSLDADEQSRAALRFLTERALTSAPEVPTPEDPSTCPNCGGSMAGEKSPYCSVQCREEAAFVRQFRRSLFEGGAFDRERQASLGQVFWHIIGGGYPRRQTLVSEKERKRIFARYEGKCQVCGATATTFDHIGSACNRTSNLTSVCERCTTTHPFGESSFLNRDFVRQKVDRLASRTGSNLPLLCCDDPDTWDWRAYVRKRTSITDSLATTG